MRRYTRLLSSILALSSFAATAHGHGGIPRALSIEFNPTNPDHVVVAASVFGQFTSVTGGESWTVSCYDAQRGGTYTMKESVPLLISTSATVFSRPAWPTMQGAGSCVWEETQLGGTEGVIGEGVKRAADGDLIAMGSLGRAIDDGGSAGITELYRSDPSGASFSLLGTPIEGAFMGDSFVLAPSSPNLVYVGGFTFGGASGTQNAIARSDDLGTTWTISPWLPNRDASSTGRRDLIAVDPSNAGLLFARDTLRTDTLTPPWQHTILFSRDAGTTWRVLHAGRREVSGFAYSPDGATIALGDAADGLFHVNVASLTSGGSPAVTKVFDYPVWGITWNERGLYAGLNQFSAVGDPEFPTVGVSHDGGRSFDPFLSICSVQQAVCPNTPEATGCYADFVKDFQVQSGRCTTNNAPGVGGGPGGSSAGAGGASGGGGAPSSGGEATSNGSVSSSDGGPGGAEPQAEELRVTSCAMAWSSPESSSGRIAFFMLVAASVASAARRRDLRAPRAESKNKHI